MHLHVAGGLAHPKDLMLISWSVLCWIRVILPPLWTQRSMTTERRKTKYKAAPAMRCCCRNLPLKCNERRKGAFYPKRWSYIISFFLCFVSHIDADAEIENVDAPDAEVAGHRVARDVQDVQDVPVSDYVSGPRRPKKRRHGGATSISRDSASTLSAYKSVANWC